MVLTLSAQCGLLIICLFIGAVNMAEDISVCKQNFKYHQSSHTCMTLIRQSAYYSTSKENCRKHRGGPNGNLPGHLVYIYDRDTDEFVKNILLKEGDVAYIGLVFQHRSINQIFYRWEDKTQPIDYGGWEGSVPTPQDGNVVISKKGWRQFGTTNKAFYICQVDAGFERPTMTCPALQAEEPSQEIQCAINKGLAMSKSEFRMTNLLVSCTHTCRYREGYDGRINENGASTTMSMSMQNVRRSDEGPLTCDWNVTGGSDILSTSCNITVYVAPKLVTCSHTFNATRAIIQCTTARIYPKGDCNWRTLNTPVELGSTINVDFEEQGYLYYSTTCTVSVGAASGGNAVSVSLYPVDANGQKLSGAPEVTTDYVFTMEPPRTPPELIKSPNHVSYKEGDTINISCTVSGGSPPVHRTRISCDREIKARGTTFSFVNESGNKADMEVNITEEMNGKSCTCLAEHISLSYTQKNWLILSVIAPAKVTSLEFIYGSRDVSEVDVDRHVQITCSASGNPIPLLSLYYTDDKQLLKNETGYKITHGVQTSCHDSGTYKCVASSPVNKAPHQVEKNLRVKCKNIYCNTEERNPKFAVVLNSDATIEMCVFAYTKPSTYYLYKGISSYSSDRYAFRFNFTNEVQARGLITLTLRGVTAKDLDNFTLYTDSFSHPGLSFTLVEQGSPSCTNDIQVKNVLSDMVTLVWKPGHDGGLRQTFIILRRDVMKEVGRVQDTNNGVMEYNVTGLSANTSYVFFMVVENEKGRTNCSNVDVNVITNATSGAESSESSESNGNPAAYIIPLVILLVLAVLGVVVVIVVRRRRRSHRDFKKMLLLEEVKTRPPKLEESKDKEEDKSLHSSIYNTATLDTSEPKNKIKPIVRKPKGNSSKSKHASSKDVDVKEDGGMEGETYAQVMKVNKQKVDKAEAAENIYNNQLEMVNLNGQKSSPGTTDPTASDWRKTETNETGDDNVVYANTIQMSSPALSEPKTSPEPTTNVATGKEKSARTLSPEGLVYVSVEISAGTKNPVIKEHKEPKEPQADQVEYTSIDHLATAESNPVVDDGQE